jgi:hypothetical protein
MSNENVSDLVNNFLAGLRETAARGPSDTDGLRLIRAFLKIANPARRKELITIAERFAEEAAG